MHHEEYLIGPMVGYDCFIRMSIKVTYVLFHQNEHQTTNLTTAAKAHFEIRGGRNCMLHNESISNSNVGHKI